MRSLSQNGWTLAVVEVGLGGNLVRRLVAARGPFISGQVIVGHHGNEDLLQLTDSYRQLQHADVGLGVAIHPNQGTQNVLMVLITPHETQQFERLYGGPPEYAPFWSINQSLDIIRRIPHAT